MDYTEKRFESDIESYLLEHGGYVKDNNTYDKSKAIDMTTLISFIKASQPKSWERYVRNYGSDAENKLYKRINDEINADNSATGRPYGLIHVLRHGITDRGVKIKIAFFRPESSSNPDTAKLYNDNILTCTRQFYYSLENTNSIDMVLSLNGIPIVALELKNQLTGQSIENGTEQYMNDRNPKELLFNFNKRILVYFTADLYNVEMTTKLEGQNTYFLPFNQGSNGAGNVGSAGNPEDPDGYATSYLWENVLSKDYLMDILQRYIHLSVEKKTKIVKDKEVTKISEKIVFPRFHQLDVVTKLVEDARNNGSGKNYLIQHSAGSGKSNSIAWLCYRLSSLHDKNNDPIFTSIIVITDRRILDSQLQETISGFDHTRGILETIGKDKSSKDLRDAINDGKKIIITTLQKFPVIYEEIDDNKGKHFAIIVDEAHSSQTGNSAKKLKVALADTEEALKEYAEIEGKAEEEIMDDEDKLVKEILTQGKQENLSFFAFTATPKTKTLELFGEKKTDGTFEPFHIYSMKQAIEEGFIFDVLKNYTTYKTCFKIAKSTPDNPELPEAEALKAIRRYEYLHPYNLGQKTAIMVEQFRSITKNKIYGNAKAMIVTASRLHALRYYFEFKDYIKSKGYKDLDVLVAFSGSIKDEDKDKTHELKDYTETSLNKRKDGTTISEKQLPDDFNSDDFNMLIVAEKYQTGFDEPLLHTMFIDKKLDGVKAVQTLSRVNRTCKGKTDTFVLDFVNTAEEIQAAFQPYYEDTKLESEIDVNLVYDFKNNIRSYRLWNEEDINNFNKIYYKKSKQTALDLGKMTSILKPTINRYNNLDPKIREEFKQALGKFNKIYSYITQIVRMFDQELHKEYMFTSYLQKLLPPSPHEKVNLDDKLKLEFYKLSETFSGEIILEASEEYNVLKPQGNGSGSGKDEARDVLEEIINKVNKKFDGLLTDGDKVITETLYNKCTINNKTLIKYAKNNDEEVFSRSIFPDEFSKIAQDCYMQSMDSFGKLFENKDFYNILMEHIGREVYKSLRS